MLLTHNSLLFALCFSLFTFYVSLVFPEPGTTNKEQGTKNSFLLTFNLLPFTFHPVYLHTLSPKT